MTGQLLSPVGTLARFRDIALLVCLGLVILDFVVILRLIVNTSAIEQYQVRDRTHAVNDCRTLQAVTQSLIDLNTNLVRIDQNGDATDKALAAQRLKSVEELKKIRPSSCGD